MQYRVLFKVRNEQYIEQIYEESLGQSKLLILHAEIILHDEDFKRLLDAFEKDANCMITHAIDNSIHSVDTIACSTHECIEAIYGHPREHYVNAITGNGFILQKECFSYLQFAKRGFHHVNCDQMPDDAFYIEDVIQIAIEHGVVFIPILAKHDFVYLKFPWDITKANILEATWITQFKEEGNEVTSLKDKTCQSQGLLKLGHHVIVQDNVRFEGNRLIGNHVTIENAVIIGKHCVIGDGSHLSHGCKIAD